MLGTVTKPEPAVVGLLLTVAIAEEVLVIVTTTALAGVVLSVTRLDCWRSLPTLTAVVVVIPGKPTFAVTDWNCEGVLNPGA